ncbi:MAG: valine--tRNA ligase [Candidatus Jorgensenbacteria bacterium]|nr:valine--tRNA ligase [Candidatus Jorgensenbacteria bacterium]
MLDSRYDSNEIEKRVYTLWEKSGFFDPDVCVAKGVTKKNAKPFSIVLPPPNVTGTLHMGHAAMLVIEDIMVRYARMKGRHTLWLPGTDHAAIATQSRVESLIYKKEGKTRHDLGREEFLKRVKQFAAESHDTITNQIRRMGSSVDWSREAYTLDEKREVAVTAAFTRMHEMGLIYRGHRIVNWDPKLQTTVSDDEVEWVEEKAPLYYLQYGPFTIVTARPETKFGDKYVVMHPRDKRYAKYKDSETIKLEWINGPVVATVVKDPVIDMKFGTGVMTVTPWHDATDFEIAERHGLEKEQIIDERGKLLPVAGEFSGMPIKKARPLIVEKLKEKGLLVKTEEGYIHRVATSSRGGGLIEPQIKEQWFVAVNKKFKIRNSMIKGIKSGSETTLKDLMRAAVKSGQVKIIPKRFEKVYFHWIENLRDWCISRQIWFGHRIPVWYHEPKCIPRAGHEDDVVKCKHMVVSAERPTCEFCDAEYLQDPDTLDTWFSSGLWTFSTLGWPKETEDLKLFHPTDVLETGYDILFFWVARMILMSGCLLGDVPVRTVYLHGLVRDEKGKKMSKTGGNVIDPLAMIQKYNADATRLSLVVGAAPGSDIKLSEDKVRGYRNFTTKIWNAGRFVLLHERPEFKKMKVSMSVADKKYFAGAVKTKKEVAAFIEKFQFHRAAEHAYHYLWHTFADTIIEEKKIDLKSDDVKKAAAAYQLVTAILTECLIMLHPFVPFVTEELYQNLPAQAGLPRKEHEMLMITPWK